MSVALLGASSVDSNMTRVILFISLCFELCCCGNDLFGKFLRIDSDPDTYRSVSELITSKGYPVTVHEVQTDDGYLITVHRIPHGRNSETQVPKKGVVLLIHGLLGDAANWVFDFPNQSLGFVLPDENYDVWLLNTRGCQYSKKHVSYSTSGYKFWNFSFHEVGLHDIPATIDYILKTTGEDQIYLVGHSQGTTSTFSMLAQKPDINRKVRLFIALAPAAFLGHVTTPLRVLVPFSREIALANDLVSHGEFFPDSTIAKAIRAQLCGMVAVETCKAMTFIVGGVDKHQVNETRSGVYAAHYPTSTSTKSLLHYSQLVQSKKFRKYDYGSSLNMKYYHQKEPPDYDLSSITTPVALFWGTEDALADPKDVGILRGKLSSLVANYCVPYPYNHFDFVLALNALELIHKPILKLFAVY